MWPVSQRYLDTIARSHTQHCYVEVIKNGVTVEQLPNVLGGSYNVSSTSIRRSGSVQLADPTGALVPQMTTDLLAPFVTDIRIWVGVRYWDAPTSQGGVWTPDNLDPNFEYVPVGTLVITQPQVSSRLITLQGYDYMWLLDNFTAPYSVAKGTNVVDAIVSLLATKIPSNRLYINIPDSDYDISSTLLFDSATLVSDAIQQMAEAAGWEIFADPMGMFTARAITTTSDPPMIDLAPGAHSVMFRPDRDIGSGSFYNAVVFTNESATDAVPLRGYAEDANPNSLTYVGMVGVRPLFASSPLMTTQTMVDKAAHTRLLNVMGISDTLTVSMVPNHALDVGDVITVTDLSQGIDTVPVIVDNFSGGLKATDGVMSIQARVNVVDSS